MASRSKLLREQGNKHYQVVSDSSVGNVLKPFRLEQASQCYQNALDEATNNDEKASASKNLCLAAYRRAELRKKDSETEYFEFMVQSLQHAKEAMQYGKNSKARSWMTDLEAKYKTYFEATTTASLETMDSRGRMLDYQLFCKAVDSAPSEWHKAHSYIKLAESYFHVGVTAVESQAYKECLSVLKECYTPLELARSVLNKSPNSGQKSDITVLEEDIILHQCIANAMQLRDQGNELFRVLMFDVEHLNMDLAWDTADCYRQSILQARENDVEGEAITLSRLGLLYDKVMKLRSYSKDCFKRCLHLASSMQPRDFTEQEWYQDAKQAIEQYEAELLRNDTGKQADERQKLLDAMKEDIEKLDKICENHSDNGKKLLAIFEAFPPVKESDRQFSEQLAKVLKKSSPEDKALRSMYKKAMKYYHPDRVGGGDPKLKCLNDEIYKRVTPVYKLYD